MHDVPAYAVVLTVAVAAVVIAIDIVFALNRRKGDTYSEVIREGARRWMPISFLVVFSMGLLAGHWFWCPDCVEVCGGNSQ